MTMTRPFAQVDVFSCEPYRGNPVAVILDGTGLDTETMERIARWTNLSETTFVLPPTSDAADYWLRIFTPTGELPFAGHPTLGSARAWLENGGIPRMAGRLVQECGAGLVELRDDGDALSFAAPPLLRTGPIEDDYLARIIHAYGIIPEQVVGHQWVDNGPGWAVVQLATADEVLALDPDFSLIPDAMVGAVGAYPEGSPHAFELRAFAPGENVTEDPVTGSLNASVAQWLTSTGQAPERYTVSQGARLGRAGEITITTEDGIVWVGGAASVLFAGTVSA
ncbi:MAG: PhzF family phenazine biosynthesis protein [Leucobacter sp.]